MKRKKKRTSVAVEKIDILNIDFLRKYVTAAGEGKSSKISPRSATGLSRRVHCKIVRVIKQARQLNLM